MAQREKMHLSHLLHITGLRSSLKTISRASVLFSVVIFVFLDPTSAPQENRLQLILDAKVAYDKSLAAVQELFESGVITRTEADREIWLAKDTLNKIKSGNIEKIYKLGGCLPINALLAKKRASVARDDSVDLFGMTEVKEEDARPMTRVKAQANVEAAMASNDPAAIEKAVDELKEFERKEKVYRDSLNSMTEGHWGAHTLGRTHLEHQLQEAIKNNDAAEVERCVDALKQMDEASQEDSVSISG
mmetsp:Transcript_75527/g.110641  ORF Transcript_75527/g.110641 Transcript_75527/m.110641 type:complete len:246 (-) Transcript_75527:736-1473(-)